MAKYAQSFDIELRKNPYKGLYLALEGPDGSGKTTQIKELEAYFTSQGREVLITSEPNDALQIGSFIRKVLQGDVTIPAVSIQYLMSADRADNHENVIYPALKKGTVVVSHRSFWSAIPYGLLDKGLAADSTREAEAILSAQGILSLYHQFITPDITFYLDLSPDEAMDRMKGRGGKQEIYEKQDKINKIVAGYSLLMKLFPDEFTSIDAKNSIRNVTKAMVEEIERR